MTDPIKDAIRAAGGIVHSDGNIFFTNQVQFMSAIIAVRSMDAVDADRYRWLRSQPDNTDTPRIDICQWTCEEGDSVNNGEGLRGDAADKAIDLARSA